MLKYVETMGLTRVVLKNNLVVMFGSDIHLNIDGLIIRLRLMFLVIFDPMVFQLDYGVYMLEHDFYCLKNLYLVFLPFISGMAYILQCSNVLFKIWIKMVFQGIAGNVLHICVLKNNIPVLRRMKPLCQYLVTGIEVFLCLNKST